MKIFNSIAANKFAPPLFILLFWLILEPFFPAAVRAYWIYGYLFILPVTLYHMNTSRKIFLIYFGVATTIVLLRFIDLKMDFASLRQIRIILALLFSLIAGINVIWYGLDFKSNLLDGITGAILGYLILALCYAMIYDGICYLAPYTCHFSSVPTDFVLQKGAIAIPAIENFYYLSFMTLTTCGYGDIHPVSAIAKRVCSIEACTGVLYLAIFVGRLFAIHQDRKEKG